MEAPQLFPCPEDHDEWHVTDSNGELYTYNDLNHAMQVFLHFTHEYRRDGGFADYDGYDPIEEVYMCRTNGF